MELFELIDVKKRVYKLEKELIGNFAKVMGKYITKEEVEARIEKNCCNGIHIVDPKIFVKLEKNTSGFYSTTDKIILIRSDMYNKMPKSIVNHELGHAFLDEKNRTKVDVEGEIHEYGYGIEEGAVSVLSELNKVDNIKIKTVSGYQYQSRLFLQLNELYRNVIDEYPNLLIHILKSNETFCNLLRKIYEGIIDDDYLVLRSALAVVASSDYITDTLDEDANDDIKRGTEIINADYLAIIRNKLELEGNTSPYFIDTVLTPEERLLKLIFGRGEFNPKFYKNKKEEIASVSQGLCNIVESRTYHK